MSQTQTNKIVVASIAVGFLFVIALLTFLFTSDDMPSKKLGGDDGLIGGDFILHGVNGKVSLSDFKGKVVVVYFGFVGCSQVCPLSMRTLQKTLDSMQPEKMENVQVILVSIDGENDSYARLEKYAKSFHKNIIGITGSREEIDQVIDEYGAYYSKNQLEESDPGRAYRHSSRYFIINRQGELVDAMRHSSTPNEIRARLRTLI